MIAFIFLFILMIVLYNAHSMSRKSIGPEFLLDLYDNWPETMKSLQVCVMNFFLLSVWFYIKQKFSEFAVVIAHTMTFLAFFCIALGGVALILRIIVAIPAIFDFSEYGERVWQLKKNLVKIKYVSKDEVIFWMIMSISVMVIFLMMKDMVLYLNSLS